jgi:hypothetical protein
MTPLISYTRVSPMARLIVIIADILRRRKYSAAFISGFIPVATMRANLIASHAARRAKVNPRTYLSSQHHSCERGGIKINDSGNAPFVDLCAVRLACQNLHRSIQQVTQELSKRGIRIVFESIRARWIPKSRRKAAGGGGGTEGIPAKREKCSRRKWASALDRLPDRRPLRKTDVRHYLRCSVTRLG